MEIKDILKSRREELGLTLNDIADQCGVSESTVSRWESGDIENMKRNRIMALANALKLSPAVIMGWDSRSNDRPPKELRAPLSPEIQELIEAAAGCTPEQIKTVVILLKTLKGGLKNGTI